MGCTYVKEFKFGGGVTEKATGEKYSSKSAMVKHEKGETKSEQKREVLKKGGKVTEKATGERYPSRKAMVKHERTETPRMQKEEVVQKQVVRGPAMAAGRDPRMALIAARQQGAPMAPPVMKKGGKFEAKVGKVMHEFKTDKLHSGSKKGPEVTNPKQAIAIALSEARKATKK